MGNEEGLRKEPNGNGRSLRLSSQTGFCLTKVVGEGLASIPSAQIGRCCLQLRVVEPEMEGLVETCLVPFFPSVAGQ